MARSPRFSEQPVIGGRRRSGGHGGDAAGPGGRAAAQLAARPLAAAAAEPGRAAAKGPGGGRPSRAAAAHRLLPAAVPARPGLRPGPGLAGKEASSRATPRLRPDDAKAQVVGRATVGRAAAHLAAGVSAGVRRNPSPVLPSFSGSWKRATWKKLVHSGVMARLTPNPGTLP